MSSSSVLTVSLYLLLCLPLCGRLCLSFEVTVKPGEDAPLQCQSPRGAEITVIKWIKPGLESERHVFFYREKRPYPHYQHPSYRGRVELKDPEMKNRDVSVVLKNVTFNDTGRYECYIGDTGSDLKFIKGINLKVTDSGGPEERGDKEGGDKEGGDKEGGDKEGGDKGLHVGLGVGLTLFVVVVFIVYKKS